MVFADFSGNTYIHPREKDYCKKSLLQLSRIFIMPRFKLMCDPLITIADYEG